MSVMLRTNGKDSVDWTFSEGLAASRDMRGAASVERAMCADASAIRERECQRVRVHAHADVCGSDEAHTLEWAALLHDDAGFICIYTIIMHTIIFYVYSYIHCYARVCSCSRISHLTLHIHSLSLSQWWRVSQTDQQ